MPNYPNNPRCGGRSMNNRYTQNGYSRQTNNRFSVESDRRRSVMPEEMPLAMAYVPWQMWQEIYSTDKGFQRGTIFRELDMPFVGKGGWNR